MRFACARWAISKDAGVDASDDCVDQSLESRPFIQLPLRCVFIKNLIEMKDFVSGMVKLEQIYASVASLRWKDGREWIIQ